LISVAFILEEIAYGFIPNEAVAARLPQGLRASRRAVLALLDAAHPLRHLLEYDHEREQMALGNGLPASLQQAA